MKIHVVIGVIVQKGKILICQRPDHVYHGGRWEFPGGKIDQEEPLLHALQRELFEEIGVTVTKAHHFYTTEYHYPDLYVWLDCFLVTGYIGTPYQKESQPQMHWVDVESLPHYDFPEANHQIIEQIMQLLKPVTGVCDKKNLLGVSATSV